MRYTVKFNNGFHKVFDNELYTDAALCYLAKEAHELAAKLNTKGK